MRRLTLTKKQIKVSLSLKEGKIKIRIKDNGNGIPEEVKDSLFNRGITFLEKLVVLDTVFSCSIIY